ncbi:TPA: hypothetical protein DF272_04350 [Candidatus Falkowbacteria bacterium]|nr:hypothetical protein [Candidatus Falkowbacteria bacterium]
MAASIRNFQSGVLVQETVGEQIVHEADDDMLQIFQGIFSIVTVIPGEFTLDMIRHDFEPGQKYWYLVGLRDNNLFWVKFFTEADLQDKETWAQAVYDHVINFLSETKRIWFPSRSRERWLTKRLRSQLLALINILGAVPTRVKLSEVESAKKSRLVQIAKLFLAQSFASRYERDDFYSKFEELKQLLKQEFDLEIN